MSFVAVPSDFVMDQLTEDGMFCRGSFTGNEIGNLSYLVFRSWYLINGGGFSRSRSSSFHVNTLPTHSSSMIRNSRLFTLSHRNIFSQSVKDDFPVPVMICCIDDINESAIR